MAYLETEFSIFNPEPTQNAFIQSKLPWIIIISYITFVKVFGPRMMKNEKPLDLKKQILSYNAVMVVLNVVLCYVTSLHFLELWPYRCDFQKSPVYTNRTAKHCFTIWCCALVKFAELLDTVFFILRKKFNQVSFLHVFHHAIMCISVTLAMQYNIYNFYFLLITSVNSGIHVLMYSYYGLSVLRPDVMREYSWCKKYLTTLQIMQFCLYLVYMLYSNLIGCGFQFKGFDSMAFFATVAITALFLNFYFRTYK